MRENENKQLMDNRKTLKAMKRRNTEATQKIPLDYYFLFISIQIILDWSKDFYMHGVIWIPCLFSFKLTSLKGRV